MRVFITGICGFVGAAVARAIVASEPNWQVFGVDNFSRVGSSTNREPLRKLGVEVLEADLRNRDQILGMPKADWVIDCAANPSVLAGFDANSSSQSVMDHNLLGTIHILEYCKQHSAGFVLVSTSRVYSVAPLSTIPCRLDGNAFTPEKQCSADPRWHGLTDQGVSERFSTQPPVSLYGVSKLASELVAMEYANAFEFPLWINRCGVMSGAGQFGKPDQGIVAFWLHSYRHRKRLKYIGFDGRGHQVRDCLHPNDLWSLIRKQIEVGLDATKPTIANVSGGIESRFSLAQLTDWCANRWSKEVPLDQIELSSDSTTRRFDCAWLVLDSSIAREHWNWSPEMSLEYILDEIAEHADANPDWLTISGVK